jgi:hypothetical protein
MAILGANFGEVAIPKVGGGYNVSTIKGTTIKHSTVAAPKKPVTTYKAPTYKAPTIKKTVPAPAKVTANYQTVAAPQVASAPITAPAPAPAPTVDDLINKYYAASQGDVNSLYDKQKTQQLADLKAQQDTATANTKQDYYNKMNQADVVNAQNVQKLREIMANNGISASGDNLTLNAKANSDRLNSLNTLNQQEQAALNDINNPSKAESIQNQIETARANALSNAKQQAYQKAWNDWQYNNMSAGQQAQLMMNKYNIDQTNAANIQSNQSALDYYKTLGFNGGSGGGVSTAGNAAYQQNLAQANKLGLPSSANSALSWLVQHESSFNPSAKNPSSTAHGYAQFLNSTQQQYDKKMGLNYNNPVDQLLEMYQYTVDRYGSPENAVKFWQQHNWY